MRHEHLSQTLDCNFQSQECQDLDVWGAAMFAMVTAED